MAWPADSAVSRGSTEGGTCSYISGIAELSIWESWHTGLGLSFHIVHHKNWFSLVFFIWRDFYSASSLLVLILLLFSIVVCKERVAVWVGSSSVSPLVTSGRTPCMLPLLHLVLFWHQLQHLADGDSFAWWRSVGREVRNKMIQDFWSHHWKTSQPTSQFIISAVTSVSAKSISCS